MKTKNNILEYKGYSGSINFTLEDNCLFGRVLGIKGSISYEGNTISELKADFQQAIDDYLYDCEQEGTIPEKPFKGTFNVRINQENHKQAVLAAKRRNISLNKFVETAIKHELERQ